MFLNVLLAAALAAASVMPAASAADGDDYPRRSVRIISPDTPGEFRELVRAEFENTARLVKPSGLKAD